MKFFKYLGIFIFSFIAVSCSTLSGFRNPAVNGNLYGMIVDENNNPVSDFKIVCEDGRKECKSTITNSNGIFMVDDVLTGDVMICGSKDGFVEIKNEKIDFTGTKKIYCWQINSTEGILEKVEKYIVEKDYEKAIDSFKGLKLEAGSEEEKLIRELKRKLKRKKSKNGVEEDDAEVEI